MKDQQHIIYNTLISTPIGKLTACATNEGICLLEFDERDDLKKQFRNLTTVLGGKIVPGINNHLLKLQEQIDRYFRWQLENFELPLVFTGTVFQERVWHALLNIPYGKTKTYLSLTKQLGDENAIRAVAAANGANKMAIIVPCHRVIGSDGKLVGYAGGLWRKEWLLNHEKGQEMLRL